MKDNFSCIRCHGVMVLEVIRHPGYENNPITQIRCTSCGNVIDEVILENRKKKE
jgi:uncharacterized Zn finger protein